MSRASVRVRPATSADVDGLVELIAASDTGAGAFSGKPLADPAADRLAARLSEILALGKRSLLVAVDDATGLVAGLLVAHPDEIGAIDLTPVLHISHLLVTPSLRRRGVGRALLAAAVHLADERGVDRVLAAVGSGSREGNRYLARLGFAPLVMHRTASIGVLRRSLGLADAPARMAILRRGRVPFGARNRSGVRVVSRGA